MRAFSWEVSSSSNPQLKLPIVLLSRYLFFLTQRPISRSNTHYLQERIGGLRSLIALLDGDEDALARSVRLLRSLNPTNLGEFAERLQMTLSPLSQTTVPRAYGATDGPPPPGFIGSARRIVLLLGPAIGIGDEIITFPLPRWIKAVNRRADITVVTAYDGLWSRVSGVDHAETYHDHLSLVRIMRGESRLGPFDLVVLIDFENPELYPAITYETRLPRYAELSLGARVMVAVDNGDRWIYRCAVPTSCFRNFYDGFDWLAQGLGTLPASVDRFDEVVERKPDASDDELALYVSPFTSKYDPSPRYWSRLLGALASSTAVQPVRVRLDPGLNVTTRRFAFEVARSAAAQSRGGRAVFEVAPRDAANGLSLQGVFGELERAHIVVCADSFTAHAAPLTGCMTLVLAGPGTEDWRVPHPSSFRFDAQTALEDVVAGMRQVVGSHPAAHGVDHAQPQMADEERRLGALDGDLARSLARGSFPELSATYARFVTARQAVVERLPTWPSGVRGLVGDYAYHVPPRALNGEQIPETLHADITRYVQNHWLEWRNTNLRKYLHLLLTKAEG